MASEKRWSEQQYSNAELGDLRRNRRASAMLERMVANPGGTVTSVFVNAAEQEGAFRFLRNDAICTERLAQSSFEATLSQLEQQEDYIVAVDQSSIAVTDRQRSKGMGRVGNQPKEENVSGFQAMNALVMNKAGAVQGLCAQQWWERGQDVPSWNDDRRAIEERESILWHRCVKEAEASRGATATKGKAWYQLDRGADSWHLWEFIKEQQLRVTIRSAYNRTLADGAGHLHDSARNSKILGGFELWLDRSNAKRAGYRPTRARRIVVRAKRVCVQLTRSKPYRGTLSMPLWVVHAREIRPPQNAERIEWFLLTTQSTCSLSDALDVIGNYTLRWRVEEFHKTWKSAACNIESSQLRSGATFKKWATLAATVAARIEQLKHVSRTDPQASALTIASRKEIDALILLAHKLVPAKRAVWNVGDDMNAHDFVHLVATWGGYTGRTSSGAPPGSITIQRGLERLLTVVEALDAVGAL